MKKDINELSREINDFMLAKLSGIKTKEAFDQLVEKVQKAGKELDSKLIGYYNNAKYDKDIYTNINKYLWMQEKFNNYNYAKAQKSLKSVCSEYSLSLGKETCVSIDKYLLNEFVSIHPDYFEESK
jgi:hypothetical protein